MFRRFRRNAPAKIELEKLVKIAGNECAFDQP